MRKLFGTNCYKAAEYVDGFRYSPPLLPQCSHEFAALRLSNADLNSQF